MALGLFEAGSRTTSYTLGALILITAAIVAWSGMSVPALADWVLEMFGISFLILLSALIFIVILCWSQMLLASKKNKEGRVWLETGQHAANAISTLALTYTLLGISLGIGPLNQELRPRPFKLLFGFNRAFSLAFMTTVVGLPTQQ